MPCSKPYINALVKEKIDLDAIYDSKGVLRDIVVKNTAFSVVDGENKTEFSVGFSRQVDSDMLQIPPTSRCARKARQDHACVLFQKLNNEWKVVDVSATIELKNERKAFKFRNSVN